MSRKSKISAAIKEQTVKLCLTGQTSPKEAAQRLGIDDRTIRRWLDRYASEGSDGLLNNASHRIYPPELKQQAVLAYLSGKGSQAEIRKIFHIRSENQLHSWLMVQSMSRVGCCIDNGPMEGFWSILKRERYYGKRYPCKQEVVTMIRNYISYDNNCRVQRKLGVLTPMEKHAPALAT